MIPGLPVGKVDMILARSGSAGLAPLTGFKENAVLTARVMGLEQSPGQAMLMINGQEMLFKIELSLMPGQELQLTVLQAKDAVVLEPAGPVAVSGKVSLGTQSGPSDIILPRSETAGSPSRQTFKENTVLTAKVLEQPSGSGQARLMINGREMVVKTGLSLTPGQEVPLNVSQATDTVVFKPAGSMEASGKMILETHMGTPEIVLPRSGTAGSQPLPVFKENTVLTARVMGQPPGPGQARLMINGQAVVAKTDLALTPGQELRLTVSQTTDTIVLRLAGPVENPVSPGLGRLLTFFAKETGIQDMFKADDPSLPAALGRTALRSDKADPGFLPKLLETGGLLLEKKLSAFIKDGKWDVLEKKFSAILEQDAKGAAMKLVGESVSKGGQTSPAAVLLDTIESLQIMNTHGADSGRYLLAFPVLEDSGFNFGQIYFDLGGKKEARDGKEEKNIKVSFLLDMTRLGRVRADFSILDRAVSGRFLLETEDIRTFTESRISDLGPRLEKIGYRLINIDCQVAEKKELAPYVFMESMQEKQPDRVVNIVI